MIPLGPVVARARVGAPRVAVWEFLTNPERRANWWAELRLNPVVGGGIAEHRDIEGDDAGRDVTGEVDVLVKGHAIGFTWHEGDERDTSVLLTLRSYGDETGVTITESGFDGLPSPSEKAAAALSDWEGLLGELSGAVEQAVADGFVVEEVVVDDEPAVLEPMADPVVAEAVVADEAPEAEEVEELEDAELPEGFDDTIAVETIARSEEATAEAEAEVQPEESIESAEVESAETEEVVDEEPVIVVEGDEDFDAEAADEVEAASGAPDAEKSTDQESQSEELEVEEIIEVEVVLDPEPAPKPVPDPEPVPEPQPEATAAEEPEGEVPLVLPGPPEEDAEKEPGKGEASTGEPDFDSLLRGPSS